MTYRLKDRELQKKLDEISNGGFSKNLRPYDGKCFSSTFCYTNNDLEGPIASRGTELIVWVGRYEVEKAPEYDPKNWNSYPEVTPPEYELMRFEYVNSYGAKQRNCAAFIKGKWVSFYGDTLDVRKASNARFRPWEDTE